MFPGDRVLSTRRDDQGLRSVMRKSHRHRLSQMSPVCSQPSTIAWPSLPGCDSSLEHSADRESGFCHRPPTSCFQSRQQPSHCSQPCRLQRVYVCVTAASGHSVRFQDRHPGGPEKRSTSFGRRCRTHDEVAHRPRKTRESCATAADPPLLEAMRPRDRLTGLLLVQSLAAHLTGPRKQAGTELVCAPPPSDLAKDARNRSKHRRPYHVALQAGGRALLAKARPRRSTPAP